MGKTWIDNKEKVATSMMNVVLNNRKDEKHARSADDDAKERRDRDGKNGSIGEKVEITGS